MIELNLTNDGWGGAMVRINLVVREHGSLKPDYSLDFELPEVPAVGSYVSIRRPDKMEPYGEDVIVRTVWWRLKHPETAGVVSGRPAKVGSLHELFVECDPASGPYSSDSWLRLNEGAKSRGIKVEEFQVSRFSVRESEREPSN